MEASRPIEREERTDEQEQVEAVARDYQSDLATPALVAEVRQLLFSERRAIRLVCRYLADLADRIHERQDDDLIAFTNEFQATACFFGLGVRETRERIRIGRALRHLPQIEAAFIAGDVSYSRVRELTRIASRKTESAWLDLARGANMRSLERQVANAVNAAIDASSAQGPLPGTRSRAPVPATHRVTFELSAEAWELLQHALETVRQDAAVPLSDAEALEAVVREALAAREHSCEGASREASDGAWDGRSDNEPARPDTTVLGSTADDAAHDDLTPGETTTQGGSSSPHTARLLRLIGGRRHWATDELLERTGLTVPELYHALLMLELDGRIRRNGGLFEPV